MIDSLSMRSLASRVSSLLRQSRVNAGKSVRELAALVGRDHTTLSRQENGQKPIRVGDLEGWAAHTGHNAHVVLTPADEDWEVVPLPSDVAPAAGDLSRLTGRRLAAAHRLILWLGRATDEEVENLPDGRL